MSTNNNFVLKSALKSSSSSSLIPSSSSSVSSSSASLMSSSSQQLPPKQLLYPSNLQPLGYAPPSSSASSTSLMQSSAPMMESQDQSSTDHYYDDEQQQPDEQDDYDSSYSSTKRSKYKLSNLIALFNKQNIDLINIFTNDKSVQFLMVIQNNLKYLIYIPSKYDMYVDRTLGIATYDLLMDDGEQEDGTEETLFYNRLPIESLRRAKSSKSKSLSRFLPLVTESPIKMMYIDEYFLSYISRHNDINSLIISSPFKEKPSYYYVTDLEFFFKNLQRLGDEFKKFERALSDAVYDRLTTEIDTARKAIVKAQKILTTLNPQQTKKAFLDATTKLTKYLEIEQHRNKASKMMVDVRSSNLNKMFNLENITYVMKEFK
jgi:hypothetical protein